jgi:hypothetical protein
MDADGDLDLMFGGMGQFDAPILDLYRNDGGTLAQADTALAKIVHGTADWGDADGDGDFDLVVAGNLMLPDETGETVVRILLNEAGGWSPVDVVHEFQSAAEPWLDFEGVTWADYDSDGDVDLLITGQQLGDGEIVGRSQVYANDAGTFTPAGAPLPGPNFGNTGGAFAWFDVDGDNDLDYFQAGGYYMPGGNGLIESRGLLFRNDASATNAAPTAPGALSSTTQSGNRVTLSWTAASDDGTPQPALTYDLYVTSSTGAAIAMSTMPQPGNVSRSTAWSLRDLPDGEYAWAVRARDSAFNRGPIAEASFQVGTVAAPPAFVRAPAFALAAAGANPAGSAGQFLLTIDRPQSVTVALYDAMGRRVAVMHDGILPAGRHRITLDGEGLANGAYFVRAVGGDGSAVQRITLER